MKVLLISPLDPKIPTNLKFLMGGENTYTRSLLNTPPTGVKYVHYQTALKTGQISYTRLHGFLRLLQKLRLLPPDAGIQCLKINQPDFDLIHCHAYGLKLIGYHGPVVLTDSSSNYLFLRDYLNWPVRSIKLAFALKRLLVTTIDAYDNNLRHKNASLGVWSKFAKSIHRQFTPKADIDVIAPGIENLPNKAKKARSSFNITFIGIWFERKGGPLLLEAYRILKLKYPKLTLTIVGSVPKRYSLPKEVKHWSHVDRAQLVKDILPNANVLVLIPPVAEGFGMVVLEAASLGIPAIVTSVYALPEIVVQGQTGFVIKPNNLTQLVARLEELILNPATAQKLGRQAEVRFTTHYHSKVTNRQLLALYAKAH